jgi:hypothetical protein
VALKVNGITSNVYSNLNWRHLYTKVYLFGFSISYGNYVIWQPYNNARNEAATAEHKTGMVGD